MGLMDIKAGNKTAKVTGGRFIQARTGTVGIEVVFRFEEDGAEERLSWIGWLSQNAIDRTMETLTDVLGFNGNDEVYGPAEVARDPSLRGVLKDPAAFNKEKVVELVVELERNPNNDKLYPRVKWVNDPGSRGAFQAMDQDVIKTTLKSVGFKAAFMAHQKGKANGTGAPKQQEQSQGSLPQVDYTEDSIPF